jgi:acyl carrier protein
MVPDVIMAVAAFPLTANGKVDKGALPEPQWHSTGTYVAPRTDTEQVLCEIWEELLGIEKPNVADSFFTLGGHSLNAVKMSNKITLTFGVTISIKAIFESPSIEKIAQSIDKKVLEGQTSEDQRVFKFHEDDAFEMESFEI